MEKITLGNLAEAFKALNAIETPTVKAPIDKKAIDECFRPSNKTDVLLEDYYDLNSTEDLQTAKDNREEEVAKAKLARIEKIVDLDADTAEDLLPSYVGKYIVQCPQCMTLFYKAPEDIEHSDDDPDTVNVNETCQHCGNVSGYSLIGKVDGITADEKDNFDAAEAENAEPAVDELDLNFGEPTEDTDDTMPIDEVEIEAETTEEPAEQTSAEEPIEKVAEEEETDEKEETEEEEEEDEDKKEESLNASKTAVSDHTPENKSDKLTLNETAKIESVNNTEQEPSAESKQESENLTLNEAKEADELAKKLKEHNDYIAYLQQMIKQEEEALGKADNAFVKAAIQRRLDGFKEDLDKAIPAEVKAEAAVEKLPSPEEIVKEEVKIDEKATTIPAEKTVVVAEKSASKETKEPLAEATVSELTGKLAQLEPFKGLNNTTIAKIIKLYVEDTGVRAKDLKVEDLKEWLGEHLGEFAVTFADNLTVNEILELGSKDPRFVKACKAVEKFNIEHKDDDYPLTDEDILKLAVAKGDAESIKLIANEYKKLKEALDEARGPGKGQKLDRYFKLVSSLQKDNLTKEELASLEAAKAAVKLFAPTSDYEIKDKENLLQQLGQLLADGQSKKLTDSLTEGSVMSEINKFIADFEDADATPVVEESVENEVKLAEVAADLDGSITEGAADKPVEDVSNADFMAMLKDPVFNEEVEKPEEIEEAVGMNSGAIETIIDRLAHAGDEAAEKEAAQKDEKSNEETAEEKTGIDFETTEDIVEESINTSFSNYLTNVYSNILNFKTSGCQASKNTLIVEGVINFKSGKTKTTKFEFTKAANGLLEGVNSTLASGKAFTLTCSFDAEKKAIVVESIAYKYNIGESLVEGLATK